MNSGRKYHSNAKSYALEIRAVSDELCVKYGLSIIQTERAAQVSKPYAEWLAEKNGQPTWRTVIRQDVDAALEQLDANGDRQLTWGEVRQSMPAIVQWVGQGMLWQCDGTATVPAWRFEALEQRTDGRYARLAATLPCAPAQAVTLRYGLMQGIE